MLEEWEKTLESAQAAQLRLASLDPAKNSSGLVSLWYTFDPLKTRDATIAPLQVLLAGARARARMRVCVQVVKGKGMGAHVLM